MASSAYSLAGKTVLITGAARGIGADAARRIAARGARVSLVGLEPDVLARVARECGPEAIWFECDVTDTSRLGAAVAGTVERTGGIDVVVSNAGIGGGGLVRSDDPVAFERVIEVNLLGACRTVKATLDHVVERRGYVLVVASLAAVSPFFPGMAAYAASKAGVEAFTRVLGVEVRHLGVDVGVAYFSWIDTDLVSGADEHPAFKFLRSRMRGAPARTYPVSAAGEAIVRGIERRSRNVVAPGWVRASLALRGILPALVGRRVERLIPEAAALFEAELERDGGAGLAHVGAGGAADAAASAARTSGSDRG